MAGPTELDRGSAGGEGLGESRQLVGRLLVARWRRRHAQRGDGRQHHGRELGELGPAPAPAGRNGGGGREGQGGGGEPHRRPRRRRQWAGGAWTEVARRKAVHWAGAWSKEEEEARTGAPQRCEKMRA